MRLKKELTFFDLTSIIIGSIIGADIHHLKKLFVSEEAILSRRLERKERFLANFIRLLHRAYRKINKI